MVHQNADTLKTSLLTLPIAEKTWAKGIKLKNVIFRFLTFFYRVIEQLVHLGKELGCYKVILDCSQKNVPFYEKCGFKVKEVQMAVYIPQKSKL